MPRLILRQPRPEARPPVGTHPRAYLADDSGLKIELPFAPREVDLAGVTPAFQTVERSGRKPLNLRSGDQLATISYDVVIANARDHHASVEPILERLRQLAKRGGRVTIGGLGPSEAGTWRLTGYSQRSELRKPGSNHITRAVVSLGFTELSDVVVRVGPITGGAKVPPKVKAKPATAGKPSPSRTHRVKAGETLTSIAIRYYGDDDRWRALGDANGITDPRRMPVGKLLRIP